jgi:hypothetical protein
VAAHDAAGGTRRVTVEPVGHGGDRLGIGLRQRPNLGDGGQQVGGRGRSPGGRGGYGSIVDAGSVLLALTPASQLVAFAPGAGQYTIRGNK